MSRKREPVRRIKEVLRLAYLDALSERQIALGANMKKTTVHDYLLRARRAGVTWADVQAMDDTGLEHLLFPAEATAEVVRAVPDWGTIHTELHRKHVTLQLLWEEYRHESPEGYGYSRFCELYRDFAGTLEVSMRQTHRAGEKAFVDYSGDGASIVDANTGEVRRAEIFVGVLGASSYTYAEATWTQGLADWIGSHVRMLQFFQGVPSVIVPDNLKSGVRKPCYYDPEINPTYQSFAEHHGVAILPARVRHPKDKAKVEGAVLLVQRWILARLRNRTFFSLGELNEAIAELLVILNQRPFKKLPGSRQSLYEQLDRPALKPLPVLPFEFPEWKDATVNIDYHVSFDDHYYSVPSRLVKDEVRLRVTETIVEVLHRGQRVAIHARSHERYRYTTLAEHMPASHRWVSEWTPVRIIEWGRKHGEHIAKIFEEIMKTKVHPEQGFRACLGIMRLGKKVGDERLDAACHRALHIGGPSYRCVRNILERGQEHVPMAMPEPRAVCQHENLRGADYYRANTEEEHHAAASNH
jgi:transposase